MTTNAWQTGSENPFGRAQSVGVEALRKDGDTAAANGLAWAYSRWTEEVAHRPLVNRHRSTLDDTWRQVIRYFGGDMALKAIAAPHNELVATYSAALQHVSGERPTEKLGWCAHCGEVVTDFCRGNFALCPKGLRALKQRAEPPPTRKQS